MATEDIKQHTRDYYRRLFEGEQRCHLPILSGKALAQALHYPPQVLLASIPDEHWQAFAACGNPLPLMSLCEGDRVLNLGCGAAIDSFALLATRPCRIQVVNMDVVFAMLERGALLDAQLKLARKRMHWVCADGEKLPFSESGFEWVVMNGVLNLFPNKSDVLKEIQRILKPCGHLVGADLCCTTALPDYFLAEMDAWAWCMSGACTEDELLGQFERAGFNETRLIRVEQDDMFSRVLFSCKNRIA